MAKMVKCKFCGKEMKDSFFSAEVSYMNMGEDVSVKSYTDVQCGILCDII